MRLVVVLAVLPLVVRPLWSQTGDRVQVELGVRVPMRDGVELAADVFRPRAEGGFPTVLLRTPYGRQEAQGVARVLAGQGHACVWQDVRGRFDSDGEWNPLWFDAEDGHDTVEWIARQPWSSGQVVMFGGSYAAGVQWLAAREGSEHLVGLIPIVGPGDGYDIVWVDGALSQGLIQMWAWIMTPSRFEPQAMARMAELPWDEVFGHMPLSEGLKLLDRDPGFLRAWLAHPARDTYWERTSWRHRPPSLPVLHQTGWFDVFQRDTIDNFMVMRARASEPARGLQRLVVGPWAHQGTGRRVGEVDFGAAAELDFVTAEMVPFLAQCFEGAAPAWEKPVKVFTMGENRWREYADWPVPGAEPTAWYLASEEGAASLAGDGSLEREPPAGGRAADGFVYDPLDPVPTRGGGNCCWPQVLPWGPMEQSDVEERDDVLVYTTEPLEEPLRVTGPVTLVLFFSSSAPDTDITAKLVDVAPDGRALGLTDGILRLRRRDSTSEPRPLDPGTVHEAHVDLGHTSMLFQAGHCVRLEVSSSNFPRFSRNTNTGRSPEHDGEPVLANQSVFHDREHPSRLVLPVLREE